MKSGEKMGKGLVIEMQNPPPYLKDRGFALNMAETKRFELLKGFTPYLVSSEGMRFVLSPVYAYLPSLHCN